MAAILRKHGWAGARRGQQFAGGADSPDVVGGPDGWHLEVKLVEALNFWQAFLRAGEEGDGARPMLVTRRNGTRWAAMVDFEVLLTLIRDAHAHRERITKAILG